MQVYDIKEAECNHADRVISKLQKQRADLEETKAIIEPYFQSQKADEFRSYLSLRDPFKFTRFLISDRYNTPSVSVSWIKIIEILYHFGMDSMWTYKQIINVYDHAALPGSGILALIHYLCTIHHGKEWSWYGNTSSANIASEDIYKLHDGYGESSNWLGNFTNDYIGIKTLSEKCHKERIDMDVFICDMGVDCGKQFAKQEELHLKSNFAQFCAATGILADGGMMICKMFTFGTLANIWLLENLTKCFVSFHICKPSSSKPNNAEVYVVGIDYDIEAGMELHRKLLNILADWKDEPTIPVTTDHRFLKSIYQTFAKICEIQTSAIHEEITLYEKHKTDQKMLRHTVGEQNKKIVEGWFSRVTLKTLNQYDWLHVLNTTPYQPPKTQAKPNPGGRRW